MQRLAGDRDLDFVGSQFFPKHLPIITAHPNDEAARKAFYYCLDVIQLMEDVFFEELELSDTTGNLYSPSYRGWIETFRILV